uniref:Uncharacterized protein n=1 Tax=Clandestinovirus TaxID=2831644 RepID=A0A8F8KRB3_9VIRU|nr:hypothetical protein KOM_12_471 [Clandestinovirus]
MTDVLQSIDTSANTRPRKRAKRTHNPSKVEEELTAEKDVDAEDEGGVIGDVEELETEDIHGTTNEIEKESKENAAMYEQWVNQCKTEHDTMPLVCDLCQLKMTLGSRINNGMHFCRKATFLSIEKKHFTKTKSVNIPTLLTKTVTGALVLQCPLCTEWHPLADSCALLDG